MTRHRARRTSRDEQLVLVTDARQQQPDATTHRVDLSEPLVDADCVATWLCVKRKRVYELARRPDDPLPSVRIGAAVRFVRSQVEEWVAGQRLH